MLPFMILAEVKKRVTLVFKAAVLILAASLFLLSAYNDSAFFILVALSLYFLAFNLLEALLPSLVSRFSPAVSKGSAMGVYSTAQFVGAFVGGALGGWVLSYSGVEVLLMMLGGASLVWLIIAFMMEEPHYVHTKMLMIGQMSLEQGEHIAQQLLTVTGVNEATVLAKEGTAYLKVDRAILDNEHLESFVVSQAHA